LKRISKGWGENTTTIVDLKHVKIKSIGGMDMGFLVKQRAFLKLYVLSWIEQDRSYGYDMLTDLRKEFAPFGYSPTHSELYTILKELTLNDYVLRKKKRRGTNPEDFQEIILYQLTEKGKDYLETYKKMMKVELERCDGLLRKALGDHYK